MAISTIGASALDSGVSQLGKNLIQNGSFAVAQRGISFTALADAYCLDRWVYTKDATTAVIDVTQSTDVPAGEGFGKSVKIDVTTADSSIAATDLARFQTRLEAQNLTQLKYGSAGAQTMTLSFWIKSTKTGTFSAFVFQPDGSRFYNASYTVNVSNTWEYKTVTITGDSGGTINDDTGTGLIVGWTLIAGTNWTGSADTWSGNADYAASSYSMLDNTSNDILITGVQLEVGSVATDFEHEDYGTTLAKCLRYYYRMTGNGNGYHIASTYNSSTTAAEGGMRWLVEMRAAPTIGKSSDGDFFIRDTGGEVNVTTLGSTLSSTFSVRWEITCSGGGLTDGYGSQLLFDSTSGNYLDFSAEL